MSRIALVSLALSTLACGCSVGDRIALEHDGESRNYFLYVPDGVAANAPVVIAMHGGGTPGGSKGRRIGTQTGLDALADEEGFIGVFPSSLGGNWNDGRDLEAGYVSPDVDDVGFIEAVLDDVAARVSIDADRVYVSGASNGGFMTQRMLCERPERFAAGVSFIATMPATLECTPPSDARVPVMFVLGTADPLVPYEGGPVANGDRGEAISADAAFAFWSDQNGCTGEPTITPLPDTDPDDGTTASREDATGCDAPVSRIVIEGGGHTWPGGAQYLPERTIGPTSNDLQGQDVLWDFVKGHSR
ncbi:MAG: prolyl oligopeptidase family serine peptidase [Myxococcota bacterium]